MPLTRGTRLGPYEIIAMLGAGGMGEVYKARDTRLDRSVAVKVLPTSVVEDTELTARFAREATTISQLNHPHICTVHDVGAHEGVPYIVMELLDGETLADRIARGPLPLADVVRYGSEIASALHRAHTAGVVHRDVKPGNVMLTKAGAKLLDFGLARSAERSVLAGDAMTTRATIPSQQMIVGTLPYMAPEQLQGATVDARTDIFAFGAVLYEMVTGRRAFDAPSAASLIAQILERQPPPVTQLQPIARPALERLVAACLQKDPDDRFQCAGDIVHELRWSREGTPEPAPRAAASRRRRAAAVAMAAAALAVIALGAYWFGRRAAPPRQATFLQLTFDAGGEAHPAISPDGSLFAFARRVDGQRDIFVQRVDGRTALNLTKDSPLDDDHPAFSPDGSQIAFRSERGGGGIYVMGATGESVRRLTDRGHDPAWSPDGKEIIFASEEADTPRIRYSIEDLYVVEIATGATRLFYKGDAMQPQWSPNGLRVAFWASDKGGRRDVYTVDRTGRAESLVAVTADATMDWNPIWSPDGRHLYFSSERDGTMNIWRIAIDEKSGRPLGEAEPLGTPAADAGFISVSRDGRHILYQSNSDTGELLRTTFDPATDRASAQPAPVFSSSMQIRHFAPSPDGQSAAVTSIGAQEDVFLIGPDGTWRQLTNDAHRDRGPTWSFDGARILFYSNRTGPWLAWSIRPDGSGLTQLTSAGTNWPRLSRDGQRLAYLSDQGGRVGDVSRGVPVESGESVPDTPRGRFSPVAWSPDGQRLAGMPWGVASVGLYVYSFADRRLQDLGIDAVMGAFVDNSRLVYVDNRDRIGVADVQTGRARTIAALPAPADPQSTRTVQVAMSADGRTILAYRRHVESDVWMMSLGRADAAR